MSFDKLFLILWLNEIKWKSRAINKLIGKLAIKNRKLYNIIVTVIVYFSLQYCSMYFKCCLLIIFNIFIFQKSNIKYLFHKEYRCTFLLLLIIWFGVTFSYYGIVLLNAEFFNLHHTCYQGKLYIRSLMDVVFKIKISLIQVNTILDKNI